MAKVKKAENSDKLKKLTTAEIIASNLEEDKEWHYNDLKDITYKVPTGSINFDFLTDGGLTPGIIRFAGPTETGKTSEALTIAKNFQDKFKDSLVMFVKCEGRLDARLIKRHGIDTSKEKWFLYESNIFEVVFKLMAQLIKYSKGKRFLFIIDSLDGLMTKADAGKSYEDAAKIAGAATMASVFFKKVSLGLRKMGHMAIFMSQERANSISTTGYTEFKVLKSSGGNAALHYPDWIFEFLPVRKMDLIWDGKPGEKDSIITGSRSRIMIRKCPNERTYEEISYPIKRRQKTGSSIWAEREIVELMEAYGIVERGKSGWFNFPDPVKERAKTLDIDLEVSIQGESKFLAFLAGEERTKTFKFLKELTLETMTMILSDDDDD